MKKKKKILVYIMLSFLLFVLYFLFFPYETEKEITLQPLFVHNLENDEADPFTAENKAAYSFKLQDTFGYIHESGEIMYKESILHNAAVSDNRYINYSSIQNSNQSLVLMDVMGNYIQSIHLPGYPFFSDTGDRLFILKTDATGIREVSIDGDQLWQAEFTSLISGFSSNDEYACVGLLNGMIQVCNKNGEVIYNYNPETRGISAIYGIAISTTSKTMAALSGTNPQDLLLFKHGKGNYHPPIKRKSIQAVRRPAYMAYTKDDAYLLFESRHNINAMDSKSYKLFTFPEGGRLTSIDTSKENQYFAASFLKSGTPNLTGLYIAKPPNLVFIKESCTMKIEFLRFMTDKVLIGFQDILLVYSITEV